MKQGQIAAMVCSAAIQKAFHRNWRRSVTSWVAPCSWIRTMGNLVFNLLRLVISIGTIKMAGPAPSRPRMGAGVPAVESWKTYVEKKLQTWRTYAAAPGREDVSVCNLL